MQLQFRIMECKSELGWGNNIPFFIFFIIIFFSSSLLHYLTIALQFGIIAGLSKCADNQRNHRLFEDRCRLIFIFYQAEFQEYFRVVKMYRQLAQLPSFEDHKTFWQPWIFGGIFCRLEKNLNMWIAASTRNLLFHIYMFYLQSESLNISKPARGWFPFWWKEKI